MSKKSLCKQAAEQSGISEEVICASLDAVEKVIQSALIDGQQVHWEGFLRAWMVEKRPAHHRTGAFLIKDTGAQKIRFLTPACEFAAGFTRPIKRIQYNIANPEWKQEWHARVMEAIKAQEEKQKQGETLKKTGDEHETVQQEAVMHTDIL